MASDRGNKPIKRGSMYVYSIVPAASVISKGWGSLVRSKTYRESNDEEKGRGEVTESRKSVSIVQERRSVSEVEANAESAAALLQVRVLASDMPSFMQVHAFRCARTTVESLDKFSSKQMAYSIKKVSLSQPYS
ncbi:hypothetical protein Salat_0837500 [Sesamum alatum]|uniref:Dynein light chain n=1 Tax=Sesamum alatum TaxID=300844 RepID=A0AAE2CQG8_9LAMI|nr:hypothetical protein Salat_0837500 [Sesamum alatum]